MIITAEVSLEGFLERWVEVTGDNGDFVPADLLWHAMLHSAGMSPDSRRVWGMTRKGAFEAMRELQPMVDRQRMRYCRAANRQPGEPFGSSRPCYERIRLTSHATEALRFPLKVQRRERPNKFMRAPHKIAANG